MASSRFRSFSGKYDSLAHIADFVREAAVEAGLENFQLYAVETAVDEACSNIIEHAYGGENKGLIDCTCITSNEGLTIILKDMGQPFNPMEFRHQNQIQKLKITQDMDWAFF